MYRILLEAAALALGVLLGVAFCRLLRRLLAGTASIRDRLVVRRLAREISRSRRAWTESDGEWPGFDSVWEVLVMMERGELRPLERRLLPRDVSHLRDRVLGRWLEIDWLRLTSTDIRRYTELCFDEDGCDCEPGSFAGPGSYHATFCVFRPLDTSEGNR